MKIQLPTLLLISIALLVVMKLVVSNLSSTQGIDLREQDTVIAELEQINADLQREIADNQSLLGVSERAEAVGMRERGETLAVTLPPLALR